LRRRVRDRQEQARADNTTAVISDEHRVDATIGIREVVQRERAARRAWNRHTVPAPLVADWNRTADRQTKEADGPVNSNRVISQVGLSGNDRSDWEGQVTILHICAAGEDRRDLVMRCCGETNLDGFRIR